MKKALDGFAKVIEVICVVLMAAMVVVVFLATVGRYTKLFSIDWSDEYARYSMVAIVYLGLMLASRKGSHFVVEIMPLLFGKKPAVMNVINIVVAVLVDAFALFLIRYGWTVSYKMLVQGKASPMLSLPLGAVYMLIPVGVALMAIFYTIHTIENLKKKEEVEKEEEEG